MPVIGTITVSYVLIGLSIDMVTREGRATLRRFNDGNAAGDIEIVAVGDEFMALVGGTPVPGKSRGDEITDAIYAFAIEKRLITGVVA